MHPDNDGNLKMEFRIIRASDKELRWLKVQGKVYFDDNEKPQRFIGTMLDITEEKKAWQLIRESEERFRMAVESTKLGTWEYQPLTGRLHWSDECKKIYNVPLDMEVDFNFFAEHIYPEDREYAKSEIEKALDPTGNGNYDIQYRILRYSDTQPRWIRAQGKVYFNDRKPERFIGTVLDITKEKMQQEELIKSIELFQTMADNVPAMIWMSGTDKFNDYFNRTWLEFTGRSGEQESNEGWLEGVHPDDVEKCTTTYNESLKEQTEFYTEYRLRRRDGQYRWIADNSVPRFSPDGIFSGFISACIDIDDQKRFREKVLESELLFKTISNTSPAALWMTDQYKQNIFINNTWLRWTGNSFTDQLNGGWFAAILEEDREKVVAHFFQCFDERKKFVAEFRIPRHDGSLRWCLAEAKPYLDIAGSFAGYAGSVTDITEIKKLEQRKDDFIKMASHELKTPITSINGYVQLLLNIYNEAETEKLQMSRSTVRSSLGTIAKQVTKLTRLISELLDLSRIESGKLELHCAEFDLNELIEETVGDVRHTTSKHAIIVESNFEGKLYGDKDRIGQVLTNLLNNAVKYSPDADSVNLRVERNDRFATLTIKDSGIGIDKKEHQRIFERFYRVEGKTEQTYPGFGIGLFIVSEIIHRHRGSIGVKSEKSRGAAFTINIPLDYRNETSH
jgi:PAS domain S-box-containing protein